MQFTPERLVTLRFDGGALGPAMQRVYEQFGSDWTAKTYGDLSSVEAEVRALLKADFPDLKEKQLKDVLSPKTWTTQKALLNKATALAQVIGAEQHDDYNAFDGTGSSPQKAKLTLDAQERSSSKPPSAGPTPTRSP